MNTNYAVGTPRRMKDLRATRCRSFGHLDRAHEEARMHLGDSVMTLIEPQDQKGGAHIGMSDFNKERKGRKFSSDAVEDLYNVNVASGRTRSGRPETGRSLSSRVNSSRGSYTSRSSTADPFNARSSSARAKNIFAESKPSNHHHHHHHHQHHHHHDKHKKVTRKKHGHHEMSITGHVRNKTMSDHLVGVDAEERLRQQREAAGLDIHATGEDTEWAAPKPSIKYGCELKSQWLDPTNNPIPPSKTYSEYQEKLKHMNMPHISYDIDGDGVVGAEDLFMAKRFDIDGNGVLDEEEQHIGKQIIAEQFFAHHTDDLDLFGREFVGKSKEENIANLANMEGGQFKKRLQQLKNIEKNLQTMGSQAMKKALTCWNPELIKNNYFIDKFDATAWNDFGAPGPRDKLFHLSNDHKGSLDTLKNLRKNKDTHYCQDQLDKAKARELDANPWMKGLYYGNKQKTNYARTADMTNQRVLNTIRR